MILKDDFCFQTADTTSYVYRISLPETGKDRKFDGIHDTDIMAGLSAETDGTYVLWSYNEEEHKLEKHTWISFDFAAYIYFKHSWNGHLESDLSLLQIRRAEAEEGGERLTPRQYNKLNRLLKRRHTIFNREIKPCKNG